MKKLTLKIRAGGPHFQLAAGTLVPRICRSRQMWGC
jgi:hypothetical protein